MSVRDKEELRKTLRAGNELCVRAATQVDYVKVQPRNISAEQAEAEERLINRLIEFATNWNMDESLTVALFDCEMEYRRGPRDHIEYLMFEMPDGKGLLQMTSLDAFDRFIKQNPLVHFYTQPEKFRKMMIRALDELGSHITSPLLKKVIAKNAQLLNAELNNFEEVTGEYVWQQIHFLWHFFLRNFEYQTARAGIKFDSNKNDDHLKHFLDIDTYFRTYLNLLSPSPSGRKRQKLPRDVVDGWLSTMYNSIFFLVEQQRIIINNPQTSLLKAKMTQIFVNRRK